MRPMAKNATSTMPPRMATLMRSVIAGSLPRNVALEDVGARVVDALEAGAAHALHEQHRLVGSERLLRGVRFNHDIQSLAVLVRDTRLRRISGSCGSAHDGGDAAHQR